MAAAVCSSRSRRPIVVAAVALALALVGCGGGGSEQAVAEPGVVPETVTTTGSTTTTVAVTSTTSIDEVRGPQDDGLRRVLLVGDSLTFGAIPALDEELSAQGVETRYVGFSATGLLSGQGWWNREITAQVEAWHPDVVVIEACCNYANGEPEYVDAAGQTVAADSEQMYTEWAAMAADAVARAGEEGAEVLWVTTPCVVEWEGSGTTATRVAMFNAISAGLGVELVDWAGALCPDGEFASTLEVDGVDVAVRADDGLHLTDAGDAVVAEVTWATIRPYLDGT
ncbi:MAG TPA: SGNH/GDSL hydrolase family protein [Iamia sp.]